MGQYWRLFNLDKDESYNCAGYKLGEFFAYSGDESHIVNLLLTGQPNHESWGGGRIVLLGDYAEALPPNTVTDDDSEFLKICAGMIPFPEGGDLRAYHELSSGGHMRRRDSIKSTTDHLPEDTVYVLRSLNKKEYVRRDTLRDYRKYDEYTTPGLTQALFALVGWSEDPSASLAYQDDDFVPASGGITIPLHRGAWAGNRIDIVTLNDDVQKTLDNDGWIDISGETARHVSDVYAGDGK